MINVLAMSRILAAERSKPNECFRNNNFGEAWEGRKFTAGPASLAQVSP